MELVEQAVFTSAETDRASGYQLVASSRGLSADDARALSAWGPSHDALARDDDDAVSFNFHQLPSGRFAVSRTSLAGWEYSNRGARQTYTQYFVVPPGILARFGNHPFAVLRAALASGVLQVQKGVPEQLEPLHLAGRSPTVDATLLARLNAAYGSQQIAALMQAMLSCQSVVIVIEQAPENLIAGLLNCLPPECRPEFSFATGLKHSTRRPLRILALPPEKEELRRAQQHGAVVVRADATVCAEFPPIDGWPRFVHRVLQSGRTSFLTTQFSKRRFKLGLDDLPALGLELLEELDEAALPTEPPPERTAGKSSSGKPAESKPAAGHWLEGLQQAHAAHQQFQKQPSRGPTANDAPSKRLDPESPEVLEQLETLDDLVFGAISGRAVTVDELRQHWSRIREELGDKLLAESREQYLRHALSIWEDCVETDGVRHPERAMQALDVLCILFDEG
jgi:hypothetical protein